MNAKKTLNKVKAVLGLQVSLEQMKLDNGTIVEAEAFEPNNEIFIVSGEDKIAFPVGDYVLEDGRALIFAEEGVISEIKEAVSKEEEVPTEEATEPEMEAAPTSPKKVVESVSKEMFFSEIEKLRNEIQELKEQKEELSKVEEPKDVELSKEESQPLKHNPEAKLEKELTLYAQKRATSTKDVVFNKLFNN